jgi:hypothetical protein
MIVAALLPAGNCRSPSPDACRNRRALRSQGPHILSKRRAHAIPLVSTPPSKLVVFVLAHLTARLRPLKQPPAPFAAPESP